MRDNQARMLCAHFVAKLCYEIGHHAAHRADSGPPEKHLQA
jgi:hypothetical protein